MLEIKLCLDLSQLAPYCRKVGRVAGPAFYAYRAENGGRVLAAGLFEVAGDTAQALYYESEDEKDVYLFDGVLRAGLNYASEQGIEQGLLPEDFRYRHRHLFENLNYPPAPRFGITNFFSKYKNCAPGRGN